LQDPEKFTQIGIIGLKTNNLATLVWGTLEKIMAQLHEYLLYNMLGINHSEIFGLVKPFWAKYSEIKASI
jgi:hypothetical protein